MNNFDIHNWQARFLTESTIVVLSSDNFKTTVKGKEYVVKYHNHDEGDSITLKSKDGDKIQGTVIQVSPDGDLTIKI